MQRVLITGGNKGIGLELTKLFVDKNFEIIVVARDFSDISPEIKDKIIIVKFDLSPDK